MGWGLVVRRLCSATLQGQCGVWYMAVQVDTAKVTEADGDQPLFRRWF